MKGKAEFGDRVEVYRAKEIFEGIYLPSPEAGSFLLKLDNGYNIAFNNKDIFEIKVIQEAEKKKEHFEIVEDGNKSTIGLVVLGGTISAKLNPNKGGVDWVNSPEDLFRVYGGIFEKVNVRVVSPFMKGSENMDYKDWQKAAKAVSGFLNDKNISGVIVIQGTDTLHFNASALSFFLKNLNKPVVLTYSQRSIDRASSDAELNLKCSISVATSDLAEVVVVGHSSSNDDFCYGLIGTKVRKLHASRRDAFKPVNISPLLRAYPDKVEFLLSYNKRNNKKKVLVDSSFEEKVGLIKFYPGQNPDILDYYLDKGYKGLVIEFSGIGNIAVTGSRLSWVKKIKEVLAKGMTICASAQTIFGRLNPLVYVTGRELADSGVIFLEDMLSETAFVKLGWVLGHDEWAKDRKTIKEKMLFNFNRELNNRLLE